MTSQGLLKKLADCEYPGEFLAARLLGKKGELFRSWDFLVNGGDAMESLHPTVFYPYLHSYGARGIWRFLQHEHLWVYSRMNKSLRRDFETYFLYHEINNLMACLRFLSGPDHSERFTQMPADSLLHDDLQKILAGGLELGATLQLLESRLCCCSNLFRGLSDRYVQGGLGPLEASIRDRFFAYILSQKPPFPIRTFFRHLIDFHNSISLAKTLRWRQESKPTVIPGGIVPVERFTKAYFRRDLTPVLNFLRLPDAASTASTPGKLENRLLGFITAKVKSWSCQRTVVSTILFYLWEQYRYTRNISMILSTAPLDNEPVRESIVA